MTKPKSPGETPDSRNIPDTHGEVEDTRNIPDPRDPRSRIKPELRVWKARKIPPHLIEWAGTLEPMLVTHLKNTTQLYERDYPALRNPLPEGLAEQAATAYIGYVKRLMGKVDTVQAVEGSLLISRLTRYTHNERGGFMRALPCDISIAQGLNRMCQDFLEQSLTPALSKRMYALSAGQGKTP